MVKEDDDAWIGKGGGWVEKELELKETLERELERYGPKRDRKHGTSFIYAEADLRMRDRSRGPKRLGIVSLERRWNLSRPGPACRLGRAKACELGREVAAGPPGLQVGCYRKGC